MPKNEDGEFELVVGNKQLLSIVFILMVLFGVVFSMGYFLGRSNTGGEQAQANSAAPTAQGGRPDAVGALASQPQSQSEAPLQPGEAQVATPDAGSGSTAPVSTTPVASETAPAQSTPAPPPPAPEREKPKPEPVAAPPGDGPAAGQTFLQVAAVRKPQAQMLLDLLRQKGFHAVMDQVEGNDVYRTLVGPVRDAGDLARTKAGLENAGFKPFVKKY